MGQIVKRKKKGRPSKADLARRNGIPESSAAAAHERDLRRSIRRRNVRYTFDYDDYIDEDDYEDDDNQNERRREKKLELLMKLQVKERGTESAPSQSRRVTQAPSASTSSSDYGDDSKPSKKRKIDGDDEIDGDVDEDDEEIDIDEVQGRKSEPKRAYSVPGTLSDTPYGVSLPNKKTLELILDKLQKKDIYGVYAEPVDPEELPDYHDVIKHPMDFSTVRCKLANGKYRTLEQFETDVFLICTNAMKYNAPDTIYYKQAFSIQELAKRKFERIKSEIEDSEKELKLEHKPISNSLPTKQINKPINRAVHEPVGFDFSPGPTPPTAVDTHKGPSAPRAVECEKPAIVDNFVEPNAPFVDINFDKCEELQQGKGLLPRLGKKPSVHDENRRATYQISNQPIATPESVFTTFEGEIKQLVAVGLHADHSYARSLARFAATLGSAAWQVAARRIEQALPPESKFGRGWVGEYEPLPTPVLMLDNQTVKEPSFFTTSQCTNDAKKDDNRFRTSISSSEHPLIGLRLEGKSMFGETGSGPTSLLPAKEEPFRAAVMEGKQSLFCSPRTRPTDSVSVSYQQQNPPARIFVETDKVLNPVKMNGAPSPDQSQADFDAQSVRYQQQNPPVRIFAETDKRVSNPLELNGAPSPNQSRADFFAHSVRYQQQNQATRTFDETDKRVLNPVELNSAPSPNQSRADFLAHSVSYQQQNQPARIFPETDKKVSRPVELNGAPSPNRGRADFAARSVSYQRQNPPSRLFVETGEKVKNPLELNGSPSPNQSRADFAAHGVSYQQQNPPARIFVETGEKVKNPLQLNGEPSPNQSRANFTAHRQISNHSELPESKSNEFISRNRNLLHSVSFKQQPNNNKVVSVGQPNEKAATNNLDGNRMVASSSDSFINPMPRAANYFPHGQEYGASDPAQLMRILTEKAQNQQKPSKKSTVDIQPAVHPVPSTRREDTGNAASTAARAWMSIGAGGLKPDNISTYKDQIHADSFHNPIRDRQPQVSRFRGEFPVAGMQFQDTNSFPLHAFVPAPHVRMGNGAQFQNQHHMVFPQLVTAPDPNRVQGGQSLWRGPQMPPRQKQESLPPDLNIGFQPTGSPVRQSSSILVDSQQPDLALQL